MWYKTFLPKLHEIVKPNNYVEIGIRHGYSLSISPLANKIAIDPGYGKSDMQFDVQNTTFFKTTSDDFFTNYNLDNYFKNSFDLGYIDGLHLFEYALRDFINLEKASNKSSIIIVDDVIPRTEEEANRKPSGGTWTGDVWKIISCLTKYRQDLASQMILAKSEPTGCLIIVSPDNNNSALVDNYENIINQYLSDDYPMMPDEKIQNIAVSAEKALDILSKRFLS